MKDDRTGKESAWDVKKILEDGKLRGNCKSRGMEVENQLPVDLKQIARYFSSKIQEQQMIKILDMQSV